MTEFTTMVAEIIELRESGYTYKEIDVQLDLPRKSYRIMNGLKAKMVILDAEKILDTQDD